MTEFVVTPTEDWLDGAVGDCSQRFLVSSPYVGNWLPRLATRLGPSVRKCVLTRTDLRDFASGASDLEALCDLAIGGAEVLGCHRLHAKVYVIDERCGLVTSANATFSGMRRNLECGVVVRDIPSLHTMANFVLKGFESSESPQRWTLAELRSLREPVRLLKQSLRPELITPDVANRELPNIRVGSQIAAALKNHLPGWTQLAIEGVQMQSSDVFDLATFVAACAPLAAHRYPRNRHVREKLRQQLQRLRDLGIIEFLGGGSYRRRVDD